MSSEQHVCPYCGQSVKRKYRHFLNKHLVKGMAEIAKYASANPREVFPNNYSLIANFQKLRYWGLVERVAGKNGHWRITPTGKDFLEGRASVYSHVWTIDGERDHFDGDLVTARTYLDAGYGGRADYAREREEMPPPPPQFQNGRLF